MIRTRSSGSPNSTAISARTRNGCWHDAHRVSPPPCHCAIVVWVSMSTGRRRGRCTRPRPRCAASAKARVDLAAAERVAVADVAVGVRAASPRPWNSARAEPASRGPGGASGARASLEACPRSGSSSYSTPIRPRRRLRRRPGLGRDRGHRLAREADPVEGHDRPVPDGVAPVGVDVERGPPRSGSRRRRGIARAAAVSTERIRACATGLCRTLPWSMPGHAHVADEPRSPRSFSAASTRRIARPTWGVPCVPAGSTSLSSRCSSQELDGLDQASRSSRETVAGAAAEVAGHRGGDRRPGRRCRRGRPGHWMVSGHAGVQKPHCTAACRRTASVMAGKRRARRGPRW